MNIAKRIKYKFQLLILIISLRLNLPWLTAWVIAKSALIINKKPGTTVLVLMRTIFMDDVKALGEFSGALQYSCVERPYFQKILEYYTTTEEKGKLTEDNYHISDIATEAKVKYREYLRKMFPILKKLLNFDAIFVGNIGYLEQQELAVVAKEFNVPVIILHKEGVAIQSLYLEFARIYKTRKVIGDLLLFYNERIKQALFQVGVSGLDKVKTAVIGIPRLDHYFKKDYSQPNTKNILFFSFYPEDKFRYIKLEPAVMAEVAKRSKEFHAMVVQFAQSHPDYTVIIKTKRSKHYLNYVTDIIKESVGTVPSNVKVVSSGDPAKMVQDCLFVLGFNSTTLLEAILVDRVVVSPYFGDLFTGQPWDYFEEYPEFIQYAQNLEEFKKIIENREKVLKYDTERKNKFLEEFIYTRDGQASKRAEELIIQTIKDFKQS